MEHPFIADMHVHTQYSHDCDTPLTTIKSISRKHNIAVAITDHNQIGGSLAARALGMSVIPGIEVTTKGLKDFLVYFHDFDNLKDFYKNYVLPNKDPGIIWGSRTLLTEQALLDATDEYDSFVSLAHPYCPIPKRSAGLPNHILQRLDAIEVMNFAMSPKANLKASILCEKTGKVHTAGSDSHVPETLGAVTMSSYADSPSEFLAAVSQGASAVIGMQRTNKDVYDKLKQFVALKVQG